MLKLVLHVADGSNGRHVLVHFFIAGKGLIKLLKEATFKLVIRAKSMLKIVRYHFSMC